MRKALGERMMGTPWNLPMLSKPSAARSTNASTAWQTPSSSSQTPSSPQTALPLLQKERPSTFRLRRPTGYVSHDQINLRKVAIARFDYDLWSSAGEALFAHLL
jgi:hypothetical protein